MDKTEERYLIYGGAGLLLAVVAFSVLKGGNNTGKPGTVPPPSPQLLSFLEHGVDTATSAAQAKSSLAAQTLLQYQQNKNELELGLTNIKAQTQVNLANAQSAEDIARIQADAATQAAQLGFASAVSIADKQANAAISAANAQSQASQAQAHANQQNGFWGAISNIIGSIAHFIP